MLSQSIGRKIRSVLKRKMVLLALLLMILFLLFIFNFHNLIWDSMNTIADKIKEETGINIGKTFYDFESAINIFRPKKDLWTGDLPIFQLKLSENDIKHFDELSEKSVQQGYRDEGGNTWRSVKLKYKENTYDAEIKLHGDNPIHWANALKSYKVKLLNNESINDLKKFDLIIFEERVLDLKIINMLSNEFGLFDVRDDFVVLKINGVPQGLYYLVESLDNTFLEHNKCSSCELIKLKGNKFKDHPGDKQDGNPNLNDYRPYGLDYNPGHVTPFDYELSHVDLEKSDLEVKKVLNSVNNLFWFVKEEDSAYLVNLFDIDYITSLEAQRMILGYGRLTGDNLRMVYKATNFKFYPIQFEGGIELLKIDQGGFEQSLNTYPPYDSELKIFALLNRDDRIRQLKYKKVYQYVSNKGIEWLNQIDVLVDYYLPYATSHKGSAVGTKIIGARLKSYTNIFKHNLDLIKDALEYATCYINVVEKGNKLTLEIIPDAISQLRFDSFKIKLLPNNKYSGSITLEYRDENGAIVKSMDIEEKTDVIDLTSVVKDFFFMTGLDEDLGTKRRVYDVTITFQNTGRILIDNIQTEMINDITGKPLDEDEVYLQIADANDYYYELIFSSPNEFMEMYKEFNWAYQDGILILLKGDYTVNRDVIIPKCLTSFDIEPGVQILIDDDKSIISYSPMNIKGIEAEPVVITSLDPDRPFGVFGVIGEKGFKTTIEWLRISGGNEKFINGLYLSGQLSLYHTDVEMKNSVVSGSHSDDGLNIKYGKILVDNCLFTNNFGDQFDGDYIEGVVKNSKFIEEDSNADDNGDGLDFSGSKVIVKNNLFKGFKDKGVSIGEGTKHIVLYDNTFENNHLGSAIKDASYAFFIKNTFRNNDVALSAYQKKIIYPGGGYFYLYDNNFESNMKYHELDEKSYKEDIKMGKETYNQIVSYVAEENLEALFPVLNPFIKNG